MPFESGVRCLARISQNIRNSIYYKQNETHILNCLVLQKEKYSKAKTDAYIKLAINIVFVLLTIYVSIRNIDVLDAALSLVAVLLVVFNRNIDDRIQQIKVSAAEIQQYIDATLYSEVTGIPIQMWGYLPEGRDAIAYLDVSPLQYDQVRNWYSDYSSLPASEQVLRCQSENIRWNSNLLQKYKSTLWGAFGVVSLVVAGFLLRNSPRTVDCLCAITWIIPLIEYGYSTHCSIKKAACSEKELEGMFKSLELHLLDSDLKIDKWNLIEIQRAIYKRRESGVMVPDFFYKFFKSKMQKTEDDIARFYNEKSRNAR